MGLTVAIVLGLLLAVCAAWIARELRNRRNQIARQLFLRHGSVMLLIKPDDGRIAFANLAAARFYGYSPRQLESMSVKDLNTLGPAEVQAELDRARREERSYFLFRHRVASGDIRTVQVHSSPLVIDGETFLLSIIDDVTHHAKLTKERETRGRVLELLAANAPLESILTELVLAYEDLAPGSICSILLTDSEESTLLPGAAPGLPEWFNHEVQGLSTGEGQGSCGTAIARKQRVIVSNIATDPLWDKYRHLAERAGLAACWSEPIFSGSRKILGSFAIYYKQVREPHEEDLQLISRHAQLASLCIEQTQLRRRQQLADHVFQNTGEGILITDDKSQILAANPAFGKLTGYEPAEILGKTPRILSSGKHPKSFYEDMWGQIRNTGKWKGEIWNKRKNGELYPELLSISTVYTKGSVIGYYVAIFTDISNIKETEARLDELAYRDPITALANRSLFQLRLAEALHRAERSGTSVWILLIDLDRFKDVNDALGHEVGNKLLEAVTGRFLEVLEPGDLLARMGGDEFGLLLENADAGRIAQRLLHSLNAPVHLKSGDQIDVGASVGISQFPHDGNSVEQLIQNADAALYDAKASGRRTFRFYTSTLTARAKARLSLETKLRRALERNEILLHYQPQVDIRTGKIVGVEALARWPDGDQMIPPDQFVPVAEESGLILPLGQSLFRKACMQARQWNDAGISLMVAVNLSARQCANARLAHEIAEVIRETGVNPEQLELEITETALMSQGQDALNLLEQMRKIGVRMALDDFGTGYSSLAYLRHFPVDTLKIDRSFISEIPTHNSGAEITSAIIRLGHSLNFTVLAEGVETEAQLAFLAKQECDLYQGYYRGRAVPPEEIPALLQ
ncbi:MAG TPA: EAL domain-containing protein [Leptospiraceae bacterium]|nr:EAL domain-containing protein [Leptospiraceae bacterium]HNN74070.1 EAL domain-containing protein [Leptospiraceae bacterium]